MLAHFLAATAAAVIGLGLAIWTSYASAPLWLAQAGDVVTRWVTPRTEARLSDTLVSLAAQDLKVDKLPVGYRYQPLSYPVPARWDDPEWGACQLQELARGIPSPKSPVHGPTDTTVDGMYGLFLASIEPPTGSPVSVQQLFKTFLDARKNMDALELQYRTDLGPVAARQWRELRNEATTRHFELAKQLQHSLNGVAGVYAQALADYSNNAYRVNVSCGATTTRQFAYSIRESLKEFREASAERVSIAGLAELLELPEAAPAKHTGQAEATQSSKLGSADVDMSFRKVRVFHIDPHRWFHKAALLTLSGKLQPDSPRFWGDEGLFPLMPVALLAVTEPVLKVKLSTEQARQVRELLSKRGTLQVGTFQFDFGKPGAYSVTSPDGSLKTELEFIAPRGEVVILGVFSKRPDLF